MVSSFQGQSVSVKKASTVSSIRSSAISRRNAVVAKAKVIILRPCRYRDQCATPISPSSAFVLPSLSWQVGDSLAEFLAAATPDPKLRTLMTAMSEAIRTIAFKVGSSIVDI